VTWLRPLLPGLAALVLALGPGAAGAEPTDTLLAGAASVPLVLPAGTPLGGYGGFPRRAWLPDLGGRHAHAFWFRPASGVHDPLHVRALALTRGPVSVLWLSVDLVGVDPSLVGEVSARLGASGAAFTAVVISATHTHSGPGAYGRSALFAFLALDRLAPAVREALVEAMAAAARQARARRGPALVGVGAVAVDGLARSRVGGPLDPELALLKLTTPAGHPVAALWSYAIHGTALSRRNALLSGDLMAHASAVIEARLGAPALYVNGAVGDVSPRHRGWDGVRRAGDALGRAALALWERTPAAVDPRLEVASGRVVLGPPAVSLRNCLGSWVPGWLRVGLAPALPDRADLWALRIGPSAWVTIPGELETALGREIKAAASPAFARVVVAGLSNDHVGYLLTPEAWGRPSYIACGSVYGPDGGPRVRDAALAVLGRLQGRLAPRRRRQDGARGGGVRRGRPGCGPARTSCGRPCSGGARPC
jgi:hypothetical protein